jgi:thioredoxin reductase (NADPH)
MVKHIYPKGHPHKEIEHYDTIVLGAGPAGLTAALYSARYALKTAVIARSIGGTAKLAGEIENWPGFMGSGQELMKRFHDQSERFGARFLEQEVTAVRKDEDGFVLEINNHEVHGRTLIIALGTEHRKLEIPGEKQFLGKGVSYCTTCDAAFFKNKIVAVIGGSDSAAKSALYLSEVAKKVYIIYRRKELRCEPIILKKINCKENIEIFYNSNPTEIKGDKKVKAMEIVQSKSGIEEEELNLPLDGVFIEVGATPVIDIIQSLGIKTDKGGYILTDKSTKTNIDGCFAAGDNTNSALKQVVVASAEGAIAARSAYNFLSNQDKD